MPKCIRKKIKNWKSRLKGPGFEMKKCELHSEPTKCNGGEIMTTVTEQ